MSEITFACPRCGVQLSATDPLFGQITNCPSCNQQFQIPTPHQALPGAGQQRVGRPGAGPQRQFPQQPDPAAQQQVVYQPAGANPRQRNAVMRTGDWMIVLLVSAIPLVGIIMLFVWAFSNGNLNRRNFARAQLIFVGIAVALGLLAGLLLGGRAMFDRLNVPPPPPVKAQSF